MVVQGGFITIWKAYAEPLHDLLRRLSRSLTASGNSFPGFVILDTPRSHNEFLTTVKTLSIADALKIRRGQERKKQNETSIGNRNFLISR
jgi:hypothetical protein